MNDVMAFDAAAATDPGWRYRQNQDAVLLDRQVWQDAGTRSVSGCADVLIAVADGLAHAPCPSRASRTVLEELATVERGSLTAQVPRTIQRRMTSRATGTRCEGMSSTLAAVQLSADGVRVVSVGDTRVYLWRGQRLRQVTVDHTIANRMVREGELSPEQARQAGSLYNDLDSALVASGFEDEFEVFFAMEVALAEDWWLCVSDGICASLSDAEIGELLASAQGSPTAESIAASILASARRSRRSDDNLSVVAAHAYSRSGL